MRRAERGIATILLLKWLGVVAVSGLLVLGAVRSYESWRFHVFAQGVDKGSATVQAKWDEDRAQALEARDRKRREDDIEAKRQLSLFERNQGDIQKHVVAVEADARTSRAEHGRVLEWAKQRVADADASIELVRSGATPSASGCQAAGTSARMLADVLEKSDERAGILAEYADRARVSGLGCERAFDDSLSTGGPP